MLFELKCFSSSEEEEDDEEEEESGEEEEESEEEEDEEGGDETEEQATVRIFFNSLAAGYCCNFKLVIFKLMLKMEILSIFCKIACS